MTPHHSAPTAPEGEAPNAEALALGTLLHLARRARHAATPTELGFIMVNETNALAAYRQGVLWFADRGVASLSGVVSPEANAPYVQWLEWVCAAFDAAEGKGPRAVDARQLPPELAAEWQEWLPSHALWLPLPAVTASRRQDEVPQHGALLLARDGEWSSGEAGLLAEWADICAHRWADLRRPSTASRLRQLRTRLAETLPSSEQMRALWHTLRSPRAWWHGISAAAGRFARLPWRDLTLTLVRPWRWAPPLRRAGQALVNGCRTTWRRPRRRYTALALLFLCFPVRLTILAPGELVPAHPAVIRAPLEGTVDKFFVSPNSRVKAGDALFQLDLTTLESRLQVARQGLATAEAEYRQSAQQAVFEAKSKAQLALLQGRIAERRTEAEYLESQLARAQVTAPLDGIALMDDPSEWVGKPVNTGERIMTVADEHDVEVEAWITLGDGIALPEDAAVTLYLNAAPLSPVSARVRYYAHEAVPRPDSSYAYRLRARLEPGETPPRVGMKGTTKIRGPWVPLSYWVLRRPLAILRQVTGL